MTNPEIPNPDDYNSEEIQEKIRKANKRLLSLLFGFAGALCLMALLYILKK
jgi:hypothetical protein